MASSTFAWPSVSIKHAGKVLVSCRVVKCEWSALFGDLLQIVDASVPATLIVQQVQVCRGQKFADPAYSVPLDDPVQLCSEYGMNILECFAYPEKMISKRRCLRRQL